MRARLAGAESYAQVGVNEEVQRTRNRLEASRLAVDAAKAINPNPQVPEDKRNCSVCGAPVGRSIDGRPGREEGFCPKCGAAMNVKQDGKLLADATRKEPVVQTRVYELQEQGADAVVAQVIADNTGKHL